MIKMRKAMIAGPKDKWYMMVTPKPHNDSLADLFKHNWRCKCPDCEGVWTKLKGDEDDSRNRLSR